jgi:hypothetical protein
MQTEGAKEDRPGLAQCAWGGKAGPPARGVLLGVVVPGH